MKVHHQHQHHHQQQQQRYSKRQVVFVLVFILTLLCYDDVNRIIILDHTFVVAANIHQQQPHHENQHHHPPTSTSCICGMISKRPNILNKVETARWMVHSISYGIITTISSRIIDISDTSTTSTSTTPTSSSSSSKSSSSTIVPIPFGNVYSFVDGPCTNSTGIPYLYGTIMDQTIQDIQYNNIVSFTLSEASMDTNCMLPIGVVPSTTTSTTNTTNVDEQEQEKHNPIYQACHINGPSSSSSSISSNHRHSIHDRNTVIKKNHHTNDDDWNSSGDPESPLCARLTITGRLVPITKPSLTTTTNDNNNNNHSNNNNNNEYDFALQSFYERHPQMKYWPTDHHWSIYKIQIMDIWFINYFGGATIIPVQEYFNFTE